MKYGVMRRAGRNVQTVNVQQLISPSTVSAEPEQTQSSSSLLPHVCG